MWMQEGRKHRPLRVCAVSDILGEIYFLQILIEQLWAVKFSLALGIEFQNIDKIEHTSRWFLSCNNHAKT